MERIHKHMAAIAIAIFVSQANRNVHANSSYMVVDLATGGVTHETGIPSDYTNNVYKTTKMVFRKVPAGTYSIQNGRVQATMEHDYYVGIYEVTVGQFKLMQNPETAVAETVANMKPKASSYNAARGTRYAADAPTAASPIGKLSALVCSGGASYQFDLPTEAMWEVAARAIPAGDLTNAEWPWFFGTTASALGNYAWYHENAGGATHVVGLKAPNAWGLYDMYGNVSEWCRDHWNRADFVPTQSGNTTDSGSNRSLRGGSFQSGGNDCSSSGRMNAYYMSTDSVYGFRLAIVTNDGTETLDETYGALVSAFEESASVSYDSASGTWIVVVTNDMAGPVVVPGVESIEINLNGNAIIGPDGDAAGNAVAPDGLPAIVLAGTNTTLAFTGAGAVSGGNGADETPGELGHGAGNGAPAVAVPAGFVGTVTAGNAVSVTGGSGGNAVDPESDPGSGAVSGVTGDDATSPDGRPAPARLSGQVLITEWRRLDETSWRLVFTTPESALRGDVANLVPDRSFSVKCASILGQLSNGGAPGDADSDSRLSFTIDNASVETGTLTVALTVENSTQQTMHFAWIAGPNAN